ncbi:conserved virulence factor C family protein [Chryseomicrobium palamuruense]|uniref:Conserved virulence factor C family protein n=1 Tax=Chryseomicrobium palamuruense TaxID=682973 RepID=A0ABV8UTP6_9BACL
MKIKTIEPTPSPNSMKIVVDQELPFGKSFNYKPDALGEAPEYIHRLFSYEGIKGIYHVADFLAVEKHPKASWDQLIPQIEASFSGEKTVDSEVEMDEHFGEVRVHVQDYHGIPLQVKVFDGSAEQRFALSSRFTDTFNVRMQDDENYIMQRKWLDYGVRYGDYEEIGTQVVAEIEAAFTDERLEQLKSPQSSVETSWKEERHPVSLEDFQHPDWQVRYQLLDRLTHPREEDLPLLALALKDEKVSIRRLAVIYLGILEDKLTIPHLTIALHDKNASIRRTAGDTMSDLGYPEFASAMEHALHDKSKLVRWRAAMFFYEVGDVSNLEALRSAEEDPEYEVRLQVKMAIARIEQGEEAKGSVWKQMNMARAIKEE